MDQDVFIKLLEERFQRLELRFNAIDARHATLQAQADETRRELRCAQTDLRAIRTVLDQAHGARRALIVLLSSAATLGAFLATIAQWFWRS